ncbi:MAG: redoxin domain-containing protein [Pirellulales bacterium]|nr:redoxin domain-containing protein [Pirellulales bacterium]
MQLTYRSIVILLAIVVAPFAAAWGPLVGNFELADYRGHTVALSDYADAKLIVVAFLGTECPLARLYAPRLVELANRYESRGVKFLAIDSNRQDSLTEILHAARTLGLTFPFLKDVGNQVADQFGAERTPEVFVLDAERRVRYRGRIDDQYDVGVQRAAPRNSDLARAIDELLSGSEVTNATTQVPGCLIGRVPLARELPKTDISPTWSGQIAAIFERRCQECHRPGEVAPFSLLTYVDVQGWEETIREVLEQRRMPPWGADPKFGDFINDNRLTEDERSQIIAWLDAGAPAGDPALTRPPAEFPQGWHIPKPDQIVFMSSRPFEIPAEGVVAYQWFYVDPGFREEKWLRATECRPGNPRVVHHITVYFKPPGRHWELKLGDRINLVGGYTPGQRPARGIEEPPCIFVPAGSQLVFEIHYTPVGMVEFDRSCIALTFADRAIVKEQLHYVLAANTEFAIPPGATEHVVESWYTLPEEGKLVFLNPHMHLRGKSFRYEASYPNGKTETLLNVPRYDFNWQSVYVLREPKRLPTGTKIHCVARFDNSAENPANPDPTATVRWGDQTWEEMMIGALAFATPVQALPFVPTHSAWIDAPIARYAVVGLAAAGAIVTLVVLRRRRRRYFQLDRARVA